MSMKWPGGLIRKTPVTPAGPYEDGAASGMWSMADAAYWKKQGLWPIAGNSLPLPIFIQMMTDGSSSQVYTNQAYDTVLDPSGNIYVGWAPNSSNQGQGLYAKLNSSGTWQYNVKFAPYNWTIFGGASTSYNPTNDTIVTSNNGFTGMRYAASIFVANAAGTITAGRYAEFPTNMGSIVDTSTGDIYWANGLGVSPIGISFMKLNSSLAISSAVNLFNTSTGVGGAIIGLSSGSLWAVTYSAPSYVGDLVQINTSGSISYSGSWSFSNLPSAGFYSGGSVGATNMYLPTGSGFGIVPIANPGGTSKNVTMTGMGAQAVAEDSAGNIYVADSNGYLAKLTSTLSVVWAVRLAGNLSGFVTNKIDVSSDGTYLLVSGCTNNSQAGLATVIKLSTTGVKSGTYAVPSAASVVITNATVSASSTDITLVGSFTPPSSTIPSTISATNSGSTTGYTNGKYP
jgi:hypothetical protein